MKITKYPQSAFVIEENGKKILIDPGNLVFEKYPVSDFDSVNAILITHQHPDHLDLEQVNKLVERDIPLYGNHDVLSIFQKEGFDITKVQNDQEFEVAGFKIKPTDIAHFKNLWCGECNEKITIKTINEDKKCKLHPNSTPKQVDGPPNTGYIFNDVFFHPGDGIKIDSLNIKNASVPIGGPTVGYEDAWSLAKSLGSKVIIPMHYSIAVFGADPNEFAKEKPERIKVVVLGDRESTNI